MPFVCVGNNPDWRKGWSVLGPIESLWGNELVGKDSPCHFQIYLRSLDYQFIRKVDLSE